MIKFSILIPAYKVLFFKEAINSVVGQTYKNWELIVVDDCSPDNLKSIVDEFDDSRIKYYRNEKNFGALDVVDNWNKCLEFATGDYTICMGDDDILCADCLEEYAISINSHPEYKLFHGRTELIDEKGQCVSILEPREEIESTLSLIYYRWQGRRQYIGDFCYEIETLRHLGGFLKLPMAWGSDDISAVRQAEVGDGLVNSNKILFKYRINRHSITLSGYYKIKCDAIFLEEEWYERFLKRYNVRTSMDKSLLVCIKTMKNSYFQMKRLYVIATDIGDSFYNILYWIKNSRRNQLNFKTVIYVILMGFKVKCKKKFVHQFQ